MGRANAVPNPPARSPARIRWAAICAAFNRPGVCLVWMLMMPFTLVEALGWIMVPVVSLTSLLVLAIEQLAVQMENPFGHDTNDLPLDAFCLTVETELIQALAESSSAQPFRDFEAEQRASPSRSV